MRPDFFHVVTKTVKERPDFEPKQVCGIEDIEPDVEYTCMHEGGLVEGSVIKFKERPKEGQDWVKVLVRIHPDDTDGEETEVTWYEEETYLPDNGVTAYPGHHGFYHPLNYLRKP